MTAEERLRFTIWLQEAEKQNTKVHKDLMVERGAICHRDESQGQYVADFVPVEQKFYPSRSALSILDECFSAHSDEQVLRDKLTILGLPSTLKVEKRAGLAQKLSDIAALRADTELRIGGKRKRTART